MELVLKASGSVSKCREALNSKIASLEAPETQENKVVRMIAHYIVQDYLDPIHDAWQRSLQDIRAANVPKSQGGQGASLPEPTEPTTSFSIDCSVILGG